MRIRVRRNLARAAGLALVAVSLLLFSNTGAAGADAGATLAAQGWWWRAAPLPAPPNVQKGQLFVQGNPTDPNGTAFAAVRYTLPTGVNASTFTLQVGNNGDQGGSSAVVLACRTGSAWSPADGGAWSAAPKVDNHNCAPGARSDDGKSWSFPIGPLQTGTVLDVAIVPGVDPTTKATSTFSLAFDAPKSESVTALSGPSAGTTATSTPATFGSAGGATAPAAVTNGATSGSTGTGGTFHPPAPTATPTGLPPDKLGETATSPANQAASQQGLNSALTPASSTSDKPNKTAGYIVLVIAGLVALYAYRQDNVMVRNGGVLPGASEEIGGLGRFAKPRSGQPPALT